MAVFKGVNEDGLIITCECGCGDMVKLEFEPDDYSNEIFFMTYYNANWGRDQAGAFDVFKEKMRKIWRIIRNKDHHYSDIRMNKTDFEVFKEYVNSAKIEPRKTYCSNSMKV